MPRKSYKKLSEEYLNDLQRLKAEFENFQKRIEAENQEIKKYASLPLIQKLLNILDNFELALKNKKQDDEFTDGISLIYKQLKNLLEEENVKEIPALNQEFDPYKHEAISHEGGEENKIIEEFQKGYIFYDKVIRPSKVKVGKNPTGGKNE